ncbi:hypothetical protein EO98_06860 [Methanosarcina sp. 2.H.T.1A.6]|nr:hypothetical protein EO94_08485 [Methanosarcina sp. 2.H.T.1A.3]KKG20218.1 hypothetical protein EO98_06860 [Methanosarcina sp. 2.H.T.1A.6]KKG26676.1 hypothetical protein EO96_03425 [Methanosarcina sp. 2.H.T.1A.8]
MLHQRINVTEPSDASVEVFSFLSRFKSFREASCYAVKPGGLFNLSWLKTAFSKKQNQVKNTNQNKIK